MEKWKEKFRYTQIPPGNRVHKQRKEKITKKGTKKGKVKISLRLYVNAGRGGGMKRWWGKEKKNIQKRWVGGGGK